MRYLHSQQQGYSSAPNSHKKYIYRGYTAAFERENDETVLIGFARCGREDIFCKQRGRLIASGRMKKKPYILKYTGKQVAAAVREFCDVLYFDPENGSNTEVF